MDALPVGAAVVLVLAEALAAVVLVVAALVAAVVAETVPMVRPRTLRQIVPQIPIFPMLVR